MKKNSNKHCKNIEFQERDVVWLRTQNIKTQQSCKKLNYKKIESYLIQEHIRNTVYRLQLLNDLLIHSVFHVSLLKKIHSLMQDQTQSEEMLIFIDDNQKWQVHDIIDSRLDSDKGFQYLIQWTLTDTWKDSWESSVNLKNSSEVIAAFHQSCSDKSVPQTCQLHTNLEP